MPICFGMLVTLLSWLWNLEALSSRTSVSSRSGARGTSPQAWIDHLRHFAVHTDLQEGKLQEQLRMAWLNLAKKC